MNDSPQWEIELRKCIWYVGQVLLRPRMKFHLRSWVVPAFFINCNKETDTLFPEQYTSHPLANLLQKAFFWFLFVIWRTNVFSGRYHTQQKGTIPLPRGGFELTIFSFMSHEFSCLIAVLIATLFSQFGLAFAFELYPSNKFGRNICRLVFKLITTQSACSNSESFHSKHCPHARIKTFVNLGKSVTSQ